MTPLYKLTDSKDQTYGRTQWGPGIEHTAKGNGPLCTGAWLHAYTDPLVGVMMNPGHASFANPHLWRAEGNVGVNDNGVKVGCTRLRTLKRMRIPKVTPTQRVRFAILCCLAAGSKDDKWVRWAKAWLKGKGRDSNSVERAYRDCCTHPSCEGRAAYAAWLLTMAMPPGAYVSTDPAFYASFAVETAAKIRTLDLPSLARQAVQEEV